MTRLDRLVDAPLQLHGVVAGCYQLCAFLVNRLGKNGGGGRSVAGDVGGLARHFFHHLGAHVLELVFQLDFFGDGDSVLRYGG